MRVAVTGANGFIGQNLTTRLAEKGVTDISLVAHDLDDAGLDAAVRGAALVYHLAGVNRPQHADEFATGNQGFAGRLVAALERVNPGACIVYTSSIQATDDNPYGRSKREAEQDIENYAARTGSTAMVFRLANVFGKWSRPNYNSMVATFCHNIARGLDITVHDPATAVRLVYIDDVCDTFIALLDPAQRTSGIHAVVPEYATTVGDVADHIRGFRDSRSTLISDRVGKGLTRALYSTYVSFLEPADFAYRLPVYADPRGRFSEMLKTPDCGQFSFFTAHPGVTRGEHYHHTKSEKFLVVKGSANFGFRHILTGECHQIKTSGDQPEVVETIPGWTHNITNVGADEMIVMLWANETFDRERPDTIAMKVKP